MQLIQGDCLEVLKTLPADSVDSIVTDPPAGISFMGKEWDKDKGGREAWIAWMTEVAKECLRVIKPGGHALVWAIPRTSHWTGTAWEQAGWEPRDKVYHAFGSGFPKSLDVSKAIDKAAGVDRQEGTALYKTGEGAAFKYSGNGVEQFHEAAAKTIYKTKPATDAARDWDGWGTALKPAVEEWWLFRKPLEGTVAHNVLEHGTGAINVDGCRVGTEDRTDIIRENGFGANFMDDGWKPSGRIYQKTVTGRWPAHLTHDGSEDIFPENTARYFSELQPDEEDVELRRVFYHAKASKKDRDDNNNHPTVKATGLMRWLCRLITPPGGVVLDPFTGSGSTGKAAVLEGFNFIGIEYNQEYLDIAKRRIEFVMKEQS